MPGLNGGGKGEQADKDARGRMRAARHPRMAGACPGDGRRQGDACGAEQSRGKEKGRLTGGLGRGKNKRFKFEI